MSAIPAVLTIASITGYALMVATVAYSLVVILTILTWRQKRTEADGGMRPVSILKPLCGLEPELYERLRSHFVQDHPCLQLVFGVSDAQDPALDTVARLRREFPEVDVAVVIDDRTIGCNPKVSNLRNMVEAARHDVLILSDSDVRVGPHYARSVSAPLGDARIGIVTCLYHSSSAPGMWSRLGAQFINSWFLPSALLARRLGSSASVFGATLALRREVLELIGGFEAVAPYLADDYMIGALVKRQGLRTLLSPYVVDTLAAESSLRALWRHQLRWARTIRVLRPTGHGAAVISLGLPVTALGLILTGLTVVAWGLFGAALLLRIALLLATRRCILVNERRLERNGSVWLMPLCDLFSFAVWCASLMTRTVYWRGRRYTVRADGSLQSRVL